MSNAETLQKTVIENDLCIGCGVCASMEQSPFSMQLNEYGCYRPVYCRTCASLSSIDYMEICPFSDGILDEDAISEHFFPEAIGRSNQIGAFQRIYAGYAIENRYRSDGSSGGLGSWILASLLNRELIDGVLHVRENDNRQFEKTLFKYQVSHSREQIKKGAKSKYYPVELSEAIKFLRAHPGRYAVVGVPCFVKALRLLSLQEDVVRRRLRYFVGLVCGHLKSSRYADMLAWQFGIRPGDLRSIDFRVTIPGNKAHCYGIRVVGKRDGADVTFMKENAAFFGSVWGYCLFKYKACDYCDDVMGETADITIGDAWLPKYIDDSEGTNIVITRHPKLNSLIQDGILAGNLTMDTLGAEEAVQSQAAGFRHRRDGLAYRLLLRKRKGLWSPKKRVAPSDRHLTEKEKKIYQMRVEMARESHLAFKYAIEQNDINRFLIPMKKLLRRYDRLYGPPFFQRIFGRLRNVGR